MTTKALIIEDEKRAAKRLKTMIHELDATIEIVETLDTVKASVDWLQNNPEPVLIFSDIQLADGLSFEIYEQVPVKSFIIFTTAYDQYAIKAFKANGIDYLLKPIDEADLSQALEKFRRMTNSEARVDTQALAQALQQLKGKYKDRFVVKVGDKLKSIRSDEVDAFYSMEKATFMFTDQKRNLVIDFSLDHLENLLNPDRFFRVSRKFIVAIDAIDEIIVWSGSRLKIRINGLDDENLLVSRDRTTAFKAWLEGRS